MSRGAVVILAVAMCVTGNVWAVWTQQPLLITVGVLLGSCGLLVLSLVRLVSLRR